MGPREHYAKAEEILSGAEAHMGYHNLENTSKRVLVSAMHVTLALAGEYLRNRGYIIRDEGVQDA